MKYFLLLVIVAKACISFAQTDPFVTNIKPGNVAGLEAYDKSGKPIPKGTEAAIDGSAMLNQHFEKGIVKFRNGQEFKDVLLNLSLINNQLYFKKDSTEMVFIIPVEQFLLPVINEGKAKTVLFKSGYPTVGKQTNRTFYQVLSDGPRVQFLKYEYKTMSEHFVYGSLPANEYKSERLFFMYNLANKQITKIAINAKSVRKALARYEAEIDRFLLQNKGKLTREDEIISLVEYINQQL